jgi:hypothetical protein
MNILHAFMHACKPFIGVNFAKGLSQGKVISINVVVKTCHAVKSVCFVCKHKGIRGSSYTKVGECHGTTTYAYTVCLLCIVLVVA